MEWMSDFKAKEYRAFEMFEKDWAIVTAGDMNHYNGCTVGWGSIGNFWSHIGKSDRPVITVMIHPARFTSKFMLNHEYFTVSFLTLNIGLHSDIWDLIREEMRIRLKEQD